MTILHIEHVRTRCSYLCYMAEHVPMHPPGALARSPHRQPHHGRRSARGRVRLRGGEISTITGQGAQHKALRVLRVLRVLGLCWGHPIGVTTPSAHLPLRGAVACMLCTSRRLFLSFACILCVVLLSVDLSRRRYLPHCVHGCAPSRP